MNEKLNGVKVAILATDGFEQSELFEPKKALEEAGATVSVVSLKSGEIKGWKENNWGDTIAVDLTVDKAKAVDFDALMLPGGVANPDKLRMEESAVNFVKGFHQQNKPIAAICHAPWLLAQADLIDGKEVTSWTSIRKDLENAGAKWVDKEVTTDGSLITSRKPEDIPAFNKKMIEEFSKAAQKGKSATQ